MMFWALLGHAGPLDPPAGPVAPSYKTLNDVEPRIPCSQSTTPGGGSNIFRISAPGSYYLTGNLTGVAGKNGIMIDADNVTLDLSGYTVHGIGALNGVIVNGSRFNITVRHGVVRDWDTGVDMVFGGTPRNTLIEDIHVHSATSWGIRSSRGGIVRGCSATSCLGYGFIVFQGSSYEDCIADGNQTGFLIGPDTALRRCDARYSTGDGIWIQGVCLVESCVSNQNSSDGIFIDSGGAGSVVRGCTAERNGDNGILAATEATIEESASCGNGTSTATGAGVRVTTSNCHIEHNQIARNDQGIVLVGTAHGNFIIRNTCADHAAGQSYVLVNTNTVGPIVTATGTISSTSPFANFEY